ncbi:MAG: DUF4935 domain-containing protein [Xanthomonadaceae bacterium]|nr:DUF4935 domain-containing protein [Xanthomonadaceae bacterium]
MTTVILDTNALRQEGLKSARMQELTQLASARHIRIVVPDVVAREYLTQWTSDVTASLATVAREANKVRQRLDSANPVSQELADWAGRVGALEQQATAAVHEEFDRWLDTSHAERLSFLPEAIKGILDDYFNGSGAFSSVKSRSDFPDALILSTVQAEVVQGADVYVVSNDGRFREAVQKTKVAGAVPSLLDLLKLPHFIDISAAATRRPDLFREVAFLDKLSLWLREATNLLEDIYVEKEHITGVELLNLPVWGVTISYPSAPSVGTSIIDLAVGGDGEQYVLSIQFDARCRVDFATYILEYFDLERAEKRALTQESQDDGVVELSEWWRATFQGTLTLSLPADKNLTPDTMSVEECRPTLAVESAILIRPEPANS